MGEGKGESVTDISMQRELRQGPRLAWQSLFIWVVFNVSKQPCQQCLAGFLAHVHTDSFMFMKDGWRWRHSLVAQGGPTCSLSNRAELCWHSYVVLLSFAEQASSSKSEFKNFWKRKEKKKTLTSTARGHLAHLPASWGHTTAERQSRQQCESCNAGMIWGVGVKWFKSNPTWAPSCSACPFCQSTILVSCVKSSSFAALTPLSLYRLPGQLSPLPHAPISPFLVCQRSMLEPCSEQASFASLRREILGGRGSFAAVVICWKSPTSGSLFQLLTCFSQTPARF